MAVSYSDAIGEHIAAKERFFSGGLQYAGYFAPDQIAPGQVTHFYFFLQNVLNVPLAVTIRINPPQTGFFRGNKPILEIDSSEIELNLAAAEAGLLTIPVTTTEHARNEGDYSLTLEVKATPKGRGDRIRPPKSQSQLTSDLIASPVGLNLVGSLGSTYVEKSAKKVSYNIEIGGDAQPTPERLSLKHTYETIWTRQNAKLFNAAVKEINLRQVNLKNELTPEALYVNLYGESVKRWADAGLALRIGEAIVLAKILTYSCQYFLSHPKLSNGLLLPIWEQAFEFEADTTDSLGIIRTIGYHHLLKLSVALSFGLIAKTFGRHFWPLEERQAVVSYIADTIEAGETLDTDFLYLPLLMAGAQIVDKLKLPGENVSHTLALIAKARQARAGLFADEEMAQANKIFNQILKKAFE
jgi:hypothetical protein